MFSTFPNRTLGDVPSDVSSNIKVLWLVTFAWSPDTWHLHRLIASVCNVVYCPWFFLFYFFLFGLRRNRKTLAIKAAACNIKYSPACNNALCNCPPHANDRNSWVCSIIVSLHRMLGCLQLSQIEFTLHPVGTDAVFSVFCFFHRSECRRIHRSIILYIDAKQPQHFISFRLIERYG